MLIDSALELVGNTPTLKINRLNDNPNVKIYAKLEKLNPGGSIKDRICKYMIERAENEGHLKKGMTIIEATSGNTGIGLAWVSAVKGYKCLLVMPETMTMERRKILSVMGAKVILSNGEKGMDDAQDLAHEIVSQDPDKYFMPNQFMNEYNVLAHYETTGKEIWQDSKGEITHFIAGLGTSGTIMGVSKRLKEYNPDIQVIAVEPFENDPISGLKNYDVNYTPSIFDGNYIDEKLNVSLYDSEDMCRLIASKEGIFCGPSSGAIMCAAIEKAKTMDEGHIVALMPDGGEKYLSTRLCDFHRCLHCFNKHRINCSLADDYLTNYKAE